MLCLPEFDTYHTLEQYARDPESNRANLALHVLKRRATLQLQWRIVCCRLASPKNYDTLEDIQYGRLGQTEEKKAPKQFDPNTMTNEQIMDVYKQAVASVGWTIDPEALAKAQQQGG